MQTPGLPYATRTDNAADRSHLNVLAICHYVCGGLIALFSSLFIVHLIIGILMLSGKMPVNSPSNRANSLQGPAADQMVGTIFVVAGTSIVLIGWTIGGLTIYSGRCIHKLKKRTFSLVMAGVCCLYMPLGTVLGVFTFIVLLRESVRGLYAENPVR